VFPSRGELDLVDVKWGCHQSRSNLSDLQKKDDDHEPSRSPQPTWSPVLDHSVDTEELVLLPFVAVKQTVEKNLMEKRTPWSLAYS
jgi:hypothetical protein